MKPIIVATALSLVFMVLMGKSCAPQDAKPAPPGGTAPETRPAAPRAETAPASKPASAPESRKLITLKQGMNKVSDADLEGSLEKWADGEEFDLQHVIKRTGVYVKVVGEVQWTDAKKRELDPKDFDRLVAESEVWAKKLVQAANDKAPADQIKTLSGELLDRCTACHLKYK
jgi:hypothetical protein